MGAKVIGVNMGLKQAGDPMTDGRSFGSEIMRGLEALPARLMHENYSERATQ